MAGHPPLPVDQFGLGPRNATFRLAAADEPPPPKPCRRRPRRPWSRLQMACWAAGVGGYGALVFAAHGARDADLLHALAIIWLITFGVINAHLIVERR